MRIRILAAGKPSLSWAKSGVGDYHKRLVRLGRYDIEFVKAGDPEKVSSELLTRSSGCFRIALDERGKALTTRQLADRMEALERRGDIKTTAFLIGAADGHSEKLRNQADLVLSLSSLTLQHELALVVLLEQLYRVADLRRGGPYHRD